MAEKKFWMVYLEDQRAPQYKHASYDSALKEAKRLAEQHDKPAYILQAVHVVKLNKFVIEEPEEAQEEDEPF